MEDGFYTELRTFVAEKLSNGDTDKEILKQLKSFGILALEEEKEILKGEDENDGAGDIDS